MVTRQLRYLWNMSLVLLQVTSDEKYFTCRRFLRISIIKYLKKPIFFFVFFSRIISSSRPRHTSCFNVGEEGRKLTRLAIVCISIFLDKGSIFTANVRYSWIHLPELDFNLAFCARHRAATCRIFDCCFLRLLLTSPKFTLNAFGMISSTWRTNYDSLEKFLLPFFAFSLPLSFYIFLVFIANVTLPRRENLGIPISDVFLERYISLISFPRVLIDRTSYLTLNLTLAYLHKPLGL